MSVDIEEIGTIFLQVTGHPSVNISHAVSIKFCISNPLLVWLVGNSGDIREVYVCNEQRYIAVTLNVFILEKLKTLHT